MYKKNVIFVHLGFKNAGSFKLKTTLTFAGTTYRSNFKVKSDC